MSKTATDRLDASIDHIPALMGFVKGNPAKREVESWLAGNANRRDAIGAALSIGGARITSLMKKETERRHRRRALMLLAIAFDSNVDETGVDGLKRAIKSWDEQRLRNLAIAIWDAWKAENQDAKPGVPFFAPSFAATSTHEQQLVKTTFDKIQKLVTRGWQGIHLAKSNPTERARFETWFGSLSDAVVCRGKNGSQRHAIVKKNLDKLQKALVDKPIKVYYRGMRVNGLNLPTDSPATEVGVLAGDGDFAWTYTPHQVRALGLDPKFHHIWLADAFFSASLDSDDSTAGTLLHELTHFICNTNDHPFPGPGGGDTYGHAKCQWIANSNNHLNLAISNADNYEFYLESYQSGAAHASDHAPPPALSAARQNAIAGVAMRFPEA